MVVAEPIQKERSALSVHNYVGFSSECLDDIVDNAPVMMHVVDRDFRIVKVNRRWLQIMGYEKSEVLGNQSTEYLTDESRVRTIASVIPSFLRTGSHRGVRADFVAKNGRVFEYLIDAECDATTAANGYRYAAIYDPRDPIQWEQAAATMAAIRELIRIRHEVENFRPSIWSSVTDEDPRVKAISGQIIHPRHERAEESTQLTTAQQEVIRILATGARNKEIAETLALSINTIKFHIENIFDKLGVNTRTQAVHVARTRNLLND